MVQFTRTRHLYIHNNVRLNPFLTMQNYYADKLPLTLIYIFWVQLGCVDLSTDGGLINTEMQSFMQTNLTLLENVSTLV